MLPVKHEPNIISLFGAYRHGRTYNILLEHADGGNLMDYFESVNPPSSEEDILQFWSSLFKVVKPIKRIHELEGYAHKLPLFGERSKRLKDIRSHQNIKPSNILVTGVATSSKYDCNFKLADLGMSHFASKTGNKRNLKRKEAFGNPMYSKKFHSPKTNLIAETQEVHLSVAWVEYPRKPSHMILNHLSTFGHLAAFLAKLLCGLF